MTDCLPFVPVEVAPTNTPASIFPDGRLGLAVNTVVAFAVDVVACGFVVVVPVAVAAVLLACTLLCAFTGRRTAGVFATVPARTVPGVGAGFAVTELPVVVAVAVVAPRCRRFSAMSSSKVFTFTDAAGVGWAAVARPTPPPVGIAVRALGTLCDARTAANLPTACEGTREFVAAPAVIDCVVPAPLLAWAWIARLRVRTEASAADVLPVGGLEAVFPAEVPRRAVV